MTRHKVAVVFIAAVGKREREEGASQAIHGGSGVVAQRGYGPIKKVVCDNKPSERVSEMKGRMKKKLHAKPRNSEKLFLQPECNAIGRNFADSFAIEATASCLINRAGYTQWWTNVHANTHTSVQCVRLPLKQHGAPKSAEL